MIAGRAWRDFCLSSLQFYARFVIRRHTRLNLFFAKKLVIVDVVAHVFDNTLVVVGRLCAGPNKFSLQ
jgi:hypothetical protein